MVSFHLKHILTLDFAERSSTELSVSCEAMIIELLRRRCILTFVFTACFCCRAMAFAAYGLPGRRTALEEAQHSFEVAIYLPLLVCGVVSPVCGAYPCIAPSASCRTTLEEAQHSLNGMSVIIVNMHSYL